MIKFLSAFLPAVDAKTLVFDGTSSLKKRAIDPDSAFEWYRYTQKYVDWESYEFALFAEKRVKTVPVLRPEYENSATARDVTQEANEVIRTLSR